MKVIIFFIPAVILCTACNNNTKEKELELRERELILKESQLKEREKDNSLNSNETMFPKSSQSHTNTEIKSSKYVYVIFKVQQPTLHHKDSEYLSGIDGIHSSITIPESNYVTYKDYTYTSEIKEISNYDENKEYEYIDQMEMEVTENLTRVNMNFEGEVFVNVRDKEEQLRLNENKAKILDRKIKSFDSYKEASIDKNENKGKF
jgi:hypothetical protein